MVKSLQTRVERVATTACGLDPWTRLAIRERLVALAASHGQADPHLRLLLTAAAAHLAAVSANGEQAESLTGTLLFLMPPATARFTRMLADTDELPTLHRLAVLAAYEAELSTGTAKRWWRELAYATVAATIAAENAADAARNIPDDLHGWDR